MQRDTYEVLTLDPGARLALGRPIADAPLNTAHRERTAVSCVRGRARRTAGATQVWVGRVTVATHVTGYVKVDLVKGLKLREVTFPGEGYCALKIATDAVWWDLPRELVSRLDAPRLRCALCGVRNLLGALLPATVACEPQDVGAALEMPDFGDPSAASAAGGADLGVRLFVYDTHGGVGLVDAVAAQLEALWRRALAVLDRCPCDTGCASCTQAGRSGGRDAGTAKREARTVLQGLLGAWMGGEGGAGTEGEAAADGAGGGAGADADDDD